MRLEGRTNNSEGEWLNEKPSQIVVMLFTEIAKIRKEINNE